MKLASAALIALFAAAPAVAGQVYVPYAFDRDNGAVRHRVEVMVTNTQPSLTQKASHRLVSGDARGLANEIALGGGESRTLRGVAGNGHRAVLEIDAPDGVAVRARLVTERSNGSRSVIELPTIGAHNALEGGASTVLQGLERSLNGRATGIGVLNLGQKSATCEASFQSSAGAPIGARVTFPLAARTEIFQEDVFNAYQEEIAAGALATVSCSQRFYAYAVVEDDVEGEVEFVGPSYEAAAAEAIGSTIPRPDATSSTIFTLPGTFLTCTKYNHNWKFNMNFGSSKTFRKVFVDFDVYVAGWDKQKPSGTHCLLWLNMGSKWENMFGYLNSTGSKGGTRFGANYGGSDFRDGKSAGVRIGNTYHVKYGFDLVQDKIWYDINKGTADIVSGTYGRTGNSFTSSSFFIEFGSQVAPEGPEAKTYGWKFSNYRGEFVP